MRSHTNDRVEFKGPLPFHRLVWMKVREDWSGEYRFAIWINMVNKSSSSKKPNLMKCCKCIQMDLYDQCQFLTEKWLELKKNFQWYRHFGRSNGWKGSIAKILCRTECTKKAKPFHWMESTLLESRYDSFVEDNQRKGFSHSI